MAGGETGWWGATTGTGSSEEGTKVGCIHGELKYEVYHAVEGRVQVGGLKR